MHPIILLVLDLACLLYNVSMLFCNLSPVEQFAVLPVFPLVGLISVNNVFVLIALIFVFFIINLLILFKNFDFNKLYGLYIIPTRLQTIFELVYKGALGLTKDNINSDKSQLFFPLIFTLFLFLLSSNLFGLVPYSYTITSHLIVTFSLSLFLFVGINIICLKTHKEKIFRLFFPGSTSVSLAFLLVPIEFISFNFKPVSLSIRLFANMMAGHTLLKVIAGFSWTLVGLGNFFSYILHLVPVLILIPLFLLEAAVAAIQSFVFTVLVCIYINDGLNLH